MGKRVGNIEVLGRTSDGALDIERQLADLRTLEDGWADGIQPVDQWGEGYEKAPSAEGLDWLRSWLEKTYSNDLLPLHIYPTPEGGVSLEWSIGGSKVSLEIDLVSHTGEWHCLNLRTGISAEDILDLDSDDGWEQLASEITC